MESSDTYRHIICEWMEVAALLSFKTPIQQQWNSAARVTGNNIRNILYAELATYRQTKNSKSELTKNFIISGITFTSYTNTVQRKCNNDFTTLLWLDQVISYIMLAFISDFKFFPSKAANETLILSKAANETLNTVVTNLAWSFIVAYLRRHERRHGIWDTTRLGHGDSAASKKLGHRHDMDTPNKIWYY